MQDIIINWYLSNKRNLPWRNTKNAYFIWLSEVILQQTRVAQGINYYLKFTENYPTVEELANADEQKILADWQGLGYYSRARNLHVAAKQIRDEYAGRFPEEYTQIIKLRGIGEYTAAAIASFAFDKVHAVVDGNVYRVLSRLYDLDEAIDSSAGKKMFQALADQLIDPKRPALFNQAIMEFGAIQCVPANPDCLNCPLSEKCLAFDRKTVKERPVKNGKTKIKKRYFHFLNAQLNDKIWIQKRIDKDIWQHLWQLPLIELQEDLDSEAVRELIHDEYKLTVRLQKQMPKHILSHQHIFSYFWEVQASDFEKISFASTQLIDLIELDQYPIARLTEKFFES